MSDNLDEQLAALQLQVQQIAKLRKQCKEERAAEEAQKKAEVERKVVEEAEAGKKAAEMEIKKAKKGKRRADEPAEKWRKGEGPCALCKAAGTDCVPKE
jgi:hypothetical protein